MPNKNYMVFTSLVDLSNIQKNFKIFIQIIMKAINIFDIFSLNFQFQNMRFDLIDLIFGA